MTRANKRQTIRRLLRKAGHPYMPATPSSMADLCATIVAARYRSVPAYLGIWKKDLILAGHPWDALLETLRTDYLRAAARGIPTPRS